jgi:hypothetical protein
MINRITMETVACLRSKCHLKQNLIPSWPWLFRHTSCISDFQCKTKYTNKKFCRTPGPACLAVLPVLVIFCPLGLTNFKKSGFCIKFPQSRMKGERHRLSGAYSYFPQRWPLNTKLCTCRLMKYDNCTEVFFLSWSMDTSYMYIVYISLLYVWFSKLMYTINFTYCLHPSVKKWYKYTWIALLKICKIVSFK